MEKISPRPSPSLSRLPPLTALRAFVVAARYANFARAAEELHVTSAAVGQQIRQLEAHLGQDLFVRTGKRLELSEAGARLLPGLTDAFQAILRAVTALAPEGDAAALDVSVAPSFAAKWLVPRLATFQSLHPALAVRIGASMALADFRDDGPDCAIRFGSGHYPGLYVEKLMDETVIAVCSPALLDGEHPLVRPAALQHHTLLHDDSNDADTTYPDWRMWLRAAGIKDVDPEPGPRFNQTSLAIEAAIAGQGVALASSRLVEADIRGGRLLTPFGGQRKVSFSYYFVAPHERLERPSVQAFLQWLRGETVHWRS
jgi:LysR family glycine cleavage system transcriptional activator